MEKTIRTLSWAFCGALFLASAVIAPMTEARDHPGGGHGGNRQASQNRGSQGAARNIDNRKTDARAANVRSTSVNSVNANKNVNINVDSRGGWDNDYHPLATTAAVVATAAVIGSVVRSVPSNCVPVNYSGMVYQQCGSTWYQPQYVGSQVQYVVINPPR
jgi:hypothetical protein